MFTIDYVWRQRMMLIKMQHVQQCSVQLSDSEEAEGEELRVEDGMRFSLYILGCRHDHILGTYPSSWA